MSERRILSIPEQHFDAALDVVDGLYQIPRDGWERRGVENPESVGEHNDALIDIGREICKVREDLDEAKLLRILQIHDWAERITGDINVYFVDDVDRDKAKAEKKAKELAAMEKICEDVGPEGKVIMALWLEYENASSPEGVIAKQIDKLQVIEKAWEYEQVANGNVNTQEFIDNAEHTIADPFLVERLNKVKREMADRGE